MSAENRGSAALWLPRAANSVANYAEHDYSIHVRRFQGEIASLWTGHDPAFDYFGFVPQLSVWEMIEYLASVATVKTSPLVCVNSATSLFPIDTERPKLPYILRLGRPRGSSVVPNHLVSRKPNVRDVLGVCAVIVAMADTKANPVKRYDFFPNHAAVQNKKGVALRLTIGLSIDAEGKVDIRFTDKRGEEQHADGRVVWQRKVPMRL